MALRSLVVMLKGLPRRVPGSGSFAPKGNLWSKISARSTEPTKSGSLQEMALSEWPDLQERMKLDREESLRQMRAHHWKMMLAGIVSIGSVGYAWQQMFDFLAEDYNHGGEQRKLNSV